MGIQSKAAAQAMLDQYYAAQQRIAVDGMSFTFSTENGTRQLTEANLPEIRTQIALLERRVTNRPGQQHNVAVANFNHSK